MEITHREEKRKGEFVVEEDGERLAELTYFTSAPGQITIYHTEVDEKLRGKDVGKKLVEAAVEYARESNLKVVAQCSFAKKLIGRTPEFQDVLAG